MASHDLKRCPICGQAPVVTKYTRYWTFLCERAGHHFVEATGRTRKATAAIWNTRAAETELREALKAVIEDIRIYHDHTGRGEDAVSQEAFDKAIAALSNTDAPA